MSADVAVSLHVDPVRAPILFQEYRTDMDGIIAGPVRNAVRDAIVRRASAYGVEEIYRLRKAELASGAKRDVRDVFQARAQRQIAQATGDAQATDLQGAALRADLEVLRLRAIEKWDGRLPQVTVGAPPFLILSPEGNQT
jgi:hypothetical protein